MPHTTAKYPNDIWDGKSESRSVHGGGPNPPDGVDYAQTIAEIIATQKHLNDLIAGIVTVVKLKFDVLDPTTVPDVTGVKGAAGEPALDSLLTALVTLGLVTDSTT